jgi:hypothetical protein
VPYKFQPKGNFVNIFCQVCAAKPGWEFKQEYVVMHSCGRCMLHRPCNHYQGGKPVHESVVKAAANIAAPTPKQLVKQQINSQAEVNLPRATGVGFVNPAEHASQPVAPAQPAAPAAPAQEVVPAKEAVPAQEAAPAQPFAQPQQPVDNSADAALEALQATIPPNERGKGVKVEIVKKTK